MRPLRPSPAVLLLAIAATAASLAAQGTPIGFEETFALSPERNKAVATLIPGSDDWYYWNCRERLDARDFATVPDAKFIAEITHREAIERGLRVMDSTALSLCMDNDLPIYVFNMGDASNIDRIVSGERVGTLVSNGPAA